MGIVLNPGVKLWEHQQKALEYVTGRTYSGLFMDMGTGKTLTALAYICQERFSKVLVLVPKKVSQVWIDEIAKFTVGATIVDLTDDPLEMRLYRLKNEDLSSSIVIVNYDVIERLGSALLAIKFDLIIADEAHRLKGYKSKNSKMAAKLKADYRIAMTGTPIHDKPLDVFGIARFLDPSIFGTAWTPFKFKYGIWRGIYNHILVGYQNQDDLTEKMSRFSYFVRREDVIDLPPQQFIDRYTDMTIHEYTAYKSLAKEYIATIGDGVVSADNALVKLIRLHQMTGGEVRLDDGRLVDFSFAKSDLLSEVLDEVPDDVVVFYAFDTERNSIARAAGDRTVYWINGHMNQYNEWRNSERGSIVAVQLQAGSEGLDLSRAHYAIYYSMTWSMGAYQQSLARLHRPGQTQSVAYIRLIINKTIDKYLYDLIDKKEISAERILSELR